MARPRGRKNRRQASDPIGPLPLTRAMEAHCEWMLMTGYTADTVRTRRVAIRRFIAWCDERGLADPREITKPILERYQRHLFYYRKPDGAPLTLGSQHATLAPLKTFFKWLARRESHPLQPGLRAGAAGAAEAASACPARRRGDRGDPARGRSGDG